MIQEEKNQESAGKGKPQAGEETSMRGSSPLLSKREQDGKGDGGICHQCSWIAHLRDIEMVWVSVFHRTSCLVCALLCLAMGLGAHFSKAR